MPTPNDISFCRNCGNDLRLAKSLQRPRLGPGMQPTDQPYYGTPPGTAPAYQPPPPGYPYGIPATQVEYGGFWIRSVTYLIDYLVINLVVLPLFLLTNLNKGLRYISLYVFAWAYLTIMTGAFGATLGKMVIGLRVVSAYDLQPIGYRTAALREIVGKSLSTICFLLGYFWAGFDSRKQAWQDKIASTVVIYKQG